jgi:hypothetical protein
MQKTLDLFQKTPPPKPAIDFEKVEIILPEPEKKFNSMLNLGILYATLEQANRIPCQNCETHPCECGNDTPHNWDSFVKKYFQTVHAKPVYEKKMNGKSRLGCEECPYYGESFLRLPCGNCIQDFYLHKKKTLSLDGLLTQGFLLGKKGIKDLSSASYVLDKKTRTACSNPETKEPLCKSCEHTFCKERIEAQTNVEITPLPKTTPDSEVMLYGYGNSNDRIDPMIEVFEDNGTHGYSSSNPWMWCHGDEYTTSKNGCIRTPISQLTAFHICYRRKNGRLLFDGRYFRDHLNNITGHISINKFHKHISN